MKILIAGSNYATDSDLFKSVCYQIGVALSNGGVTLLLGSDNPRTADYHVFLGYSSTQLKDNRVNIIRPEKLETDSKTPFHGYRDTMKIQYLRKGKNWSNGRVYQVIESDLVLCISGGKGTEQIINTALALGKPILTIPNLQGVSKTFWDSSIREVLSRVGKLKDHLATLNEEWVDSNAGEVMIILKSIYKNNPFRLKKYTVSEIILLVLTVVSISLWSFLLFWWQEPGVFRLLPLCFSSAFLGVLLRNGIKRLNDEGFYFGWKLLFGELSVAFLITLGLMLFFISGGFVIEGGFEFLNPENDPDHKYRTGISVSILGFTAGYLIEKSSNRLRALLETQT